MIGVCPDRINDLINELNNKNKNSKCDIVFIKIYDDLYKDVHNLLKKQSVFTFIDKEDERFFINCTILSVIFLILAQLLYICYIITSQ